MVSKKKESKRPKSVSKIKESDEYELVPELKFKKLATKVEEISKSPFVSAPGVDKMSMKIDTLNLSILSLLEVLKEIADNNNFEETEQKLITTELKPLIKEINKIKKQNDDLSILFNNIVDRLNDLSSKVDSISYGVLPNPVEVSNPSLPPLQGGPESPVEAFSPPQVGLPQNMGVVQNTPSNLDQGLPNQNQASQQMPSTQPGVSPDMNLNPVDLPPLEPKKKKFSFLKK